MSGTSTTHGQGMTGLRGAAFTGFWTQNAALVQLLGLCPLLAITTTTVNGLALGLMTTAVLIGTNAIVSMIRGALTPVVRIPLFVLVIASLVTCVDLLSNAFLHELHTVLGLFIPLIITNCAILAQAETVASRNGLSTSVVSGFATGLGFGAVLVVLGFLRELAGYGTMLRGFPMLTGGPDLTINLPFDGMLVAILPPGAFFGLAALLVLRNLLTRESGSVKGVRGQ
jgi:Na+-translocating ferredoxin:NAD+ oxidoreductase subunit E